MTTGKGRRFSEFLRDHQYCFGEPLKARLSGGGETLSSALINPGLGLGQLFIQLGKNAETVHGPARKDRVFPADVDVVGKPCKAGEMRCTIPSPD